VVKTQVASYPAQVHAIYIQLDRFPAHFFWVSPGFGFRRVLDLAEHAAIALAAAVCFSSSVLAFCSLTLGASDHVFILAQFLATPSRPLRTEPGTFPADPILCTGLIIQNRASG